MKQFKVVGNRLFLNHNYEPNYEFLTLIALGSTEYVFPTPVVEMVQIMKLAHEQRERDGFSDAELDVLMATRAIELTERQAQEVNVLLAMLSNDEVVLDDQE